MDQRSRKSNCQLNIDEIIDKSVVIFHGIESNRTGFATMVADAFHNNIIGSIDGYYSMAIEKRAEIHYVIETQLAFKNGMFYKVTVAIKTQPNDCHS